MSFPGGRHSFIWPKRVSQRAYTISPFRFLNWAVFVLDWKLGDDRSTFAAPTVFKNTLFRDFSWKN